MSRLPNTSPRWRMYSSAWKKNSADTASVTSTSRISKSGLIALNQNMASPRKPFSIVQPRVSLRPSRNFWLPA